MRKIPLEEKIFWLPSSMIDLESDTGAMSDCVPELKLFGNNCYGSDMGKSDIGTWVLEIFHEFYASLSDVIP